jgi:hypothetical protein
VQDQVDGHVRGGELNSPQHRFRVIDVDVAHYRKAQQAHGLLTMYEGDGAAASLALELCQQPQPPHLQETLLQGWLQG